MALNPIYVIASAYRAVLLGGQDIPLLPLPALASISCCLLVFALGVFRRVKGYFPAVV